MQILTSFEANRLKRRPRKTVKVKGNRGYKRRAPSSLPGQLAKDNAIQSFAEQFQGQIRRYGMSGYDVKHVEKLIAGLRGLVEEHRPDVAKQRARDTLARIEGGNVRRKAS